MSEETEKKNEGAEQVAEQDSAVGAEEERLDIEPIEGEADEVTASNEPAEGDDAFASSDEVDEEEAAPVEANQLKMIIEAALLASGEPLNLDALRALFGQRSAPPKEEMREAIKELQEDYEGRGVQLLEVASGFRIQVRETMSPWLSKLWEERPPRYSRALMETLAIIAYRQPLTRGDIEEIRGVAVSTNIIRSLLDRSWIRPVGQRDVPGRPTLYATTKQFLDYFGLKRLEDLPPLAELAELDPVNIQLELGVPPDTGEVEPGVAPGATEPLVSQAKENDLPDEPASVTSLDEVREAQESNESDESSVAEVEETSVDAPNESASSSDEDSGESDDNDAGQSSDNVIPIHKS